MGSSRGAFLQLWNEAYKGANGGWQEDAVDRIEEVYSGLSDINKKAFCRKLVDRNDFFQDAYGEIMDKMNIAIAGQRNGVERNELR